MSFSVGDRMRRVVAFCLLGLGSGFGTASASELNVEDLRWNLDGLVRHGQFNTLTLLVSNVSATDFDGVLEFYQGGTVAPTRRYTQPVFLGKEQTTRVAYDVYIGSYEEGGLIRWGPRDNQSYDVPSPSALWPWKEIDFEGDPLSVPPVVWVDTGLTAAPTSGGSVRPLPPRWFPVSAAALPTDAVVALSQDPGFQPAQRQAFSDWVRLGGTVYVFPNGSEFDEFSGEMAFLNRNTPRNVVGRGAVIREERQPRDLSADDWRLLARSRPRDRFASAMGQQQGYNNYQYDYVQVNFADSVYEVLSFVHRPKVIWSLVFLLFFVYIAAIVVGGIVVSKKTRDWKATYATLGVLIATFSGLFWWVGARGHGEETEALSIVAADLLVDASSEADKSGTRRARLHGWTQFFTTSSGSFELKPVDGRTAIRPREYVAGAVIVDGPTGALSRSIPVYSAASFEWQGISDITTPVVGQATYDREKRRAIVDLQGVGANAEVRLVRNGRVTMLNRDPAGFVGSSWTSVQPFTALEPQSYEIRSRLEYVDTRDQIRSQVLDTLESWLQQYSRTDEQGVLDNADDAGVLLVLDDLPAELTARFPDATHRGRILYRIPVEFSANVNTDSPDVATRTAKPQDMKEMAEAS